MQKNIYNNHGNYYKKIKTCQGRFKGMYEWQPMKKFLWFFIPDHTKETFILDDYDFVPIKQNQKNQKRR